MIGPVKVTPVLAHSSTSTLSSYFPKGKWVSLNDFSAANILNVATGGMQTLQSTMADDFPILHLAQGGIIPFVPNTGFMTTTDVLNAKEVQLLVNLDDSFFASGEIYLDDGVSINPSQTFINMELQAGNAIGGSLKFYKDRIGQSDMLLTKVVIAGAKPIMNVDFSCVRDLTDPMNTIKKSNADPTKQRNLDFTVVYDPTAETLTFTPKATGVDIASLLEIDVLYFGTQGADFNFCADKSFQATQTKHVTVNDEVIYTVSPKDPFNPELTVTKKQDTTTLAERYQYNF